VASSAVAPRTARRGDLLTRACTAVDGSIYVAVPDGVADANEHALKIMKTVFISRRPRKKRGSAELLADLLSKVVGVADLTKKLELRFEPVDVLLFGDEDLRE
jgi:hypothetical protein